MRLRTYFIVDKLATLLHTTRDEVQQMLYKPIPGDKEKGIHIEFFDQDVCKVRCRACGRFLGLIHVNEQTGPQIDQCCPEDARTLRQLAPFSRHVPASPGGYGGVNLPDLDGSSGDYFA